MLGPLLEHALPGAAAIGGAIEARLVGAGIGVLLASVLFFQGFWAFLVALIFAVVGGAVARYWLVEG